MPIRWFFGLLVFIPMLQAEEMSASQACQLEVQKIDQQIEQLEQKRQHHLELARQYQQEGDNWQYLSGNIQDGYRSWGQANQERRKVIDIDTEIEMLNDRKQRIFQFYPQLEWEQP